MKAVEINGIVSACLSNAKFRVILENGFEAIVHVSGKMRCNYIRVMLYDHVLVALSPYDLTRGRIIYRYKPYQIKKNLTKLLSRKSK